jgi:hypothetical protein
VLVVAVAITLPLVVFFLLPSFLDFLFGLLAVAVAGHTAVAVVAKPVGPLGLMLADQSRVVVWLSSLEY